MQDVQIGVYLQKLSLFPTSINIFFIAAIVGTWSLEGACVIDNFTLFKAIYLSKGMSFDV